MVSAHLLDFAVSITIVTVTLPCPLVTGMEKSSMEAIAVNKLMIFNISYCYS